MIAVSMDLAVENGKKYHQRSEALHSLELTMWHSRFKFADKNSREPEGNLALTQREREKHKEKCLIVREQRSGLFQGQNKVCRIQAFQKKEAILACNRPTNWPRWMPWSSFRCGRWWPLFCGYDSGCLGPFLPVYMDSRDSTFKVLTLGSVLQGLPKLMESSWGCLSWAVNNAGRVSDGPLSYLPVILIFAYITHRQTRTLILSETAKPMITIRTWELWYR